MWGKGAVETLTTPDSSTITRLLPFIQHGKHLAYAPQTALKYLVEVFRVTLIHPELIVASFTPKGIIQDTEG